MAALYDPLARWYSRGRIGLTKQVQEAYLRPGDAVLYPGIGRGEEARQAAVLGARVTGVDVSEKMLAPLRRHFAEVGSSARLVLGDVSEHVPEAPYDLIAAHYFLNLFDAARARAMLVRFAQWLRPGGRLLLADFARPTGGAAARAVTALYYRPLNAIAWGLGLCAWHPILDYRTLLSGLPFRVDQIERFPVLRAANPAYVSIVATRVRNESEPLHEDSSEGTPRSLS